MPTTYEEQLRASFWLFCWEINRRYGRTHTDLHNQLINGLDLYDWSCWQMFRGYAKTMIGAVYKLLHMAWTIDNTYGVYLSGNESQVKDGLRKMSRIAKRVPFLRKDLDHALKFEIEFKNGSLILGKTYGSNIRGMGNEERRPNILVGDDIIPDRPNMTMEAIIDVWRKAVEPAMEPGSGSKLILIGTPFTPDDIYSVVEKDDRYFFQRQPIYNKQKESVWPERYPTEMVRKIEKNIDAMTFAQQYLCMPMNPAGVDFKVRWLRPYNEPPLKERTRFKYATCDLAVAESKKADYAGISEWYHKGDNWYLIDAWAPKGITDVGIKLLELDRDPDVKVVMIEAPGTLHQMCMKDPNIRQVRKAVYVTGVVGNKVERVGTLEPWFRNGYVYVKMKTNGAPANAPFFWREYTSYNRRQPPKDLHILDGFQMLVEEYGGSQGLKYHRKRK